VQGQIVVERVKQRPTAGQTAIKLRPKWPHCVLTSGPSISDHMAWQSTTEANGHMVLKLPDCGHFAKYASIKPRFAGVGCEYVRVITLRFPPRSATSACSTLACHRSSAARNPRCRLDPRCNRRPPSSRTPRGLRPPRRAPRHSGGRTTCDTCAVGRARNNYLPSKSLEFPGPLRSV
jgi:hypothetical protein